MTYSTKVIVWETDTHYCATTAGNYYAYIQDARKINRVDKREFESFSEFCACVCNWYKTSPENVVFPRY